MRLATRIAILALVLLLSACGYNQIQSLDEQTKASWSDVINQYQRRADLVPNLVATVKGYAQQEKDILIQVTEARSRVGSIQVTPELANDPAKLKQFQDAQGQLGSALSRLMVVTENYPNLKSDQSFRDLQAQLEGTENRITVARTRYIQAVQDYNTYIRSFPQNLTASYCGYKVKPNFTVANEAAIAAPPTVDFSQPAPAAQPAAPRQPASRPAAPQQPAPQPSGG
ncbi:MAG TPA: LemA family protein [Xanthomonadaceae bacterium]|jgi:LemA protein|nr:LemA family protein [Xanthomonadaceae bacterium]